MKKLALLIAIVFAKFTFAQFEVFDTLNYGFVDISATGTEITSLTDDGEYNLTTPYTVYLLDLGTNSLRIGNNGAILFDTTAGNVGATNGDLLTSVPMIAPFWDDFDTEQGGVYYEEKDHYYNGIIVASEFIIQWDRVHFDGSSNVDTASFQVVFHQFSKEIDFVYNDVDLDGSQWDYGASATIGISTADSVYQYSKNTPSLNGVTSIVFKRKRTYVPDDNFEAYLENNGMGNNIPNDNYVYTSNIKDVTILDISNQNITDITGIEDFEALTILLCSNNSIINLDISNNINLTKISCYDNDIASINVANLTKLKEIYCHRNNLSEIDLSSNILLEYLACGETNITNLDLTSNTNLKFINAKQSLLETIDVTNCTLLEELYVQECSLTELNLDNNSNLVRFNCENNQLSTLHIQNGANSLLSGTYASGGITYPKFNASINFHLTCVYVDNATDATAGVNDYQDWAISSNSHYVETDQECMSYSVTYVPDDNFEAYLEANGMGNGVDNDDYVLTSNINNVYTLNVSNKNITDFTGIEGFTVLVDFYANDNPNTTNFNINNNINLETLHCYSMGLDSLNISNLVNLEELFCFYNSITSLDISNNESLMTLSCSYNQLTSINLGNNPNLSILTAFDNQLTDLDVTNCSQLEKLNIGNNSISSIDISSNLALKSLYCTNNIIETLDLDNNTNIEVIDASNNNLTELHIQNGANNLLSGTYNTGGPNYSRFISTGNPNLTCIYVDNETDANAGVNDYYHWEIDATSHFVETEQECQALDISDIISDNDINIYPNPASNYINIDIDNLKQVQIIDINGKTVLTESTKNKTIDVSELTNGLYTIKVITDKNIYSNQIIINN